MVYRVSGINPGNSYTPVKTLGNSSDATPGESRASGRTLATGRSAVGTTGTPLRSQFRVGAAVAAKAPSHTRRRSCGATSGYKTRSMCRITLLYLLTTPSVCAWLMKVHTRSEEVNLGQAFARIKNAEATDV